MSFALDCVVRTCFAEEGPEEEDRQEIIRNAVELQTLALQVSDA